MSVFSYKSEKKEHEIQYMHDVDAAMHRRGHPWAFLLSLAVLLFFAVFFVWADNAMIDDVTRGTGQIIPAEGVQPIQSEHGGTITEIFVAENQQVERNQPLVSVSNVLAVAELRDLEQRKIDLTLALKRLNAEELDTDLTFSPEDTEAMPESVSAQLRLFQTRKGQYEGQSELLRSQLESRKREVAEARERREGYENALELLREEEKTILPLLRSGAYSQIDYLELRQRIVTQEGELNSVAQTIARAESGVEAAQERLANLRAERQAAIADEINKARVELNAVEQKILAGGEQVTRTELRSPVRGTIIRIILKKDSVAKPAETIMEILPVEGALEVEARFSPADRGFLFVNQPAMVKVTAYDFSIYGGLEATVVKISDDTIEDKRGDLWYEVRLLTTRKSILYQGKELSILPGMTVTVDVLTDKRSVLSYVLGPLRRAMQNAMTEH